jgi:flavin-dependent dehydrogenase
LVRKNGSKLKVAVIGGSAAGLFTAYQLARNGHDTQVVEGKESLGGAPRSLIVTHRMREVLGGLGEKAVVNEIRRFELFTDGRVAKIELQHPDLIIERKVLIQELAQAASSAGARINLGRKFQSLQSRPHGLTLTLESLGGRKEEVSELSTIIGADGAASRVARNAGLPKPLTAPLVQAIVNLPPGMSADTVRVWFIPDDTPYFYWLIPHSSTQGVLGLIGEDGPTTKMALDRFLEKRQLTPLSFQGARIPVYTGWTPVRREMDGGDVYLVGDAAGHVKVSTVGGIVTGFRGALGVVEAMMNGGSSRKLKALRRELDTHLLVRKLIHGFKQEHYSHLVDLLSNRVRKDLEAHTRDEPGGILWRLCLHQPRYILVGLRALLSGSKFPNPIGEPEISPQ